RSSSRWHARSRSAAWRNRTRSLKPCCFWHPRMRVRHRSDPACERRFLSRVGAVGSRGERRADLKPRLRQDILGMVGKGTIGLFLIGLPALAAGTWAGLKLFGRLDEVGFRRVVLGLVLVSGVSLLLNR